MRQFAMPESTCPHCQLSLNRCTDPSGLDSPNPGDVSICICCAGLLKYGPNLELQKLEEIELNKMATENPDGFLQLMRIRSAVEAVKDENRP